MAQNILDVNQLVLHENLIKLDAKLSQVDVNQWVLHENLIKLDAKLSQVEAKLQILHKFQLIH